MNNQQPWKFISVITFIYIYIYFWLLNKQQTKPSMKTEMSFLSVALLGENSEMTVSLLKENFFFFFLVKWLKKSIYMFFHFSRLKVIFCWMVQKGKWTFVSGTVTFSRPCPHCPLWFSVFLEHTSDITSNRSP